MSLKDFNFAQLDKTEGISVGKTTCAKSDNIHLSSSCNNPSSWTCSHGTSTNGYCAQPGRSGCAHYN